MQIIMFLKQYFTSYLFVTLLTVGIYESMIEPKFLMKKGLDRDSKICRIIGIVYLVIDISAYIFSRFNPL
ncbi:CLC_0170 family protein [Aceticella autotrophica]|jgi:hypothetical protein|nr:CLC_0170 family protein [Aceticella autotrophica]MDI6604742.1 hypothetical protein [Thermoanaerobacteraceae bacterium]